MLLFLKNWWGSDDPYLPGKLRFAYYIGLLLFSGVSGGPLWCVRIYTQTEKIFHFSNNFLPAISINWLYLLLYISLTACFCSAIGLQTRAAKIICFIGFFLIFGITNLAFPTHRNYFLICTLFLLCFYDSNDSFSIDYYLSKYGLRTLKPTQAGSWAIKMMLLILAYIYTCAGLSKIWDAGLRWIDGSTLRYYAGEHVNLISNILVDNEYFSILSSSLVLFFELSSLLLITKSFRIFYLAFFLIFHFIVAISLGPNFFLHCWSFILLIPRANCHVAKNYILKTSFAFSLFCLMIFVTAKNIEFWPLSSFDMYSAYYSKNITANLPIRHFETKKGIDNIITMLSKNKGSRWLKWEMGIRTCVTKNSEFLPPEKFGLSYKQWASRIAPMILIDLKNKQKNLIIDLLKTKKLNLFIYAGEKRKNFCEGLLTKNHIGIL